MKPIPVDRLICGEMRLLSDAFVDDELQAETTLSVIRHAGRCSACRGMIDGSTRLKARVQSAARAAVTPPSLRDRVRHMVRGW